ncbi:MAG TPA: hypothetical protein ENN80_12430, partial [Candidatus Hydrogenedentes bacterium]|nr:hypothetical protein [Candidatus Hydrogenedentota bacterium]
WGRLQFLSNADLMTLKAGGQFVAFPANHQTLVTGTSDGTVALHDLATGEPARTFVEKEGYGYVAQLSTDGTRLAVNGDQGVTVLDVASGETLFTYDDVKPTEGAWSRAMAFSRNGSRIAARVDKGRVLIWDIGGTERATIPLERNKGFTMTFSPDGRRLLCAATVLGANGWENAFVLHDAAAGGVLSSHALPAPPFVHALVFSPDGRHVAIGTDETLSVWAVDGWEQRAELAIAVYYPGTVAFSPDGNMVAAGARDDGTLLVWDLAAGIERHRIKAHVEAIHAVRFDPTGERIATAGSDRLAKVWNASTARLLTEIRGHNGPVFSLDFNKANTRLATASYDGTTKLWAVDSALAAAQPSAMDACTKHGILAGSTGANVTIWDIRSGHVRQTIETRDAPTTHLAFSPDGGILATAPKSPEGDTYPITLWNTETAAAIGSLKAPLNTLTRLSFSPNGRHLAVRGGAKLQLWDTQTRDQLRDFDGVVDAVFSPDGAWLATGAIEDRTGRIALSNVAESVPTATFEVTSLRDLCLAFSPDSTLFLASHDDSSGDSPGAVRIWDLSTQAERATLAGHGQSVTCMSFTSDGKHLATGSNDKNIIIWNVATHEKLHTLTGHAGNIVHVGFNRDGRRLVSASLDGTFRMWDAVTGRELLTLQAAALRTQDAPSRAFFSPDERQLVVLTEPQALQPIVLHCFPASLEAYPGTADTPLQERVEAYKRQYWRVADDGA